MSKVTTDKLPEVPPPTTDAKAAAKSTTPAKRESTDKLKAKYETLAEKVEAAVKDLRTAERELQAKVKEDMKAKHAAFDELKAQKLAAFTAWNTAKIEDDAVDASKPHAEAAT